LQNPLGQKLAVPLVHPMREPLEADEIQKVALSPADEDFDRLLDPLATPLAFPGVPAAIENPLRMDVLELDAYEETRRVVDLRIGSHEEAHLRIDADEERRVEAERVLPESVMLLVVGSVLHLETMLIGRAIPREAPIREERITDDAEPLPRGSLERDPEWRLIGRVMPKDPAPFALKGPQQEGEERLLVTGADGVSAKTHERILARRLIACKAPYGTVQVFGEAAVPTRPSRFGARPHDTLLRDFPGVLVVGPRQCGRTTLVRSARPKWELLYLERPSDLSFLSADVEGFLDAHPKHVAFDEVQRLSDLGLKRGFVVTSNDGRRKT